MKAHLHIDNAAFADALVIRGWGKADAQLAALHVSPAEARSLVADLPSMTDEDLEDLFD